MHTPRQYARAHLHHFATTRGPLLGDPRAAVIRAIALGAVEWIVRHGSGDVAITAANTFVPHTKFAPSKRSATRREFAAASALFADLSRAATDARSHMQAFEAVLEVLLLDEERGDLFAWARVVARARLLATAMTCDDARLRLIAARTLLTWTKGQARRVGYGECKEEGEACLAPTTACDRQAVGATHASPSHSRLAESAHAPPLDEREPDIVLSRGFPRANAPPWRQWPPAKKSREKCKQERRFRNERAPQPTRLTCSSPGLFFGLL